MLVRSVVFSPAHPGPRQRGIQSTALPEPEMAPADTVEPPEEEEAEGEPEGRGAGTEAKRRLHSRRLTPASKLRREEGFGGGLSCP